MAKRPRSSFRKASKAKARAASLKLKASKPKRGGYRS